MKRAVVCMLVTMLGLAVAGPALAKPSIAVLGLEVVEETDTPDAKAAQYAETLTEALRSRARSSSGPFTLAAGSDKSLVEMKLLSGCDNEAGACMAGIGTDLAADRLIFGHVQKVGANYQITLKLLNVSNKSVERTTSDLAPVNDNGSSALTALGKKLYAKITGVSNQGTLIVKANVERGEVFLDGERKASLSGGTARIEGLAAGDYKLKVETDCYLAYEGTVAVEGGKDAKAEVDLEKNALSSCGGTGDGGGGGGGGDGGGGGGGGGGDGRIISGGESDDVRPGGGSRALFYVSAGVAAAGAGFWIYNWREMVDKSPDGDISAAERMCPGASNCDALKDASRNTYIGGAVLGIGVAAGAYFFYKGFIAPPKRRERSLNARAPRRNPVLVAPTVSATQVGGVVRIEF